MKNSSLGSLLFFALLLAFNCFSCRKVGSVARKAWSKQTIRKVGSYAGGAILLISLDELIANDMLNIFENGSGNPGGEVIIKNLDSHNINFQMSIDGLQWHDKLILANNELRMAAGVKGIISIRSDEDGYFMLAPDKEYGITQENNKIKIEEIRKVDD